MLFPSVNNAPSWTATQHSRQSQWWTAPKKSAPLRRHHPGSISGCGTPFRNAHTATNWPGDIFLRTSSQYCTHNKLRRFQNNNYKLNRKRVIEGWSQNGMRRLGLVSTPWWEEGTGERLLAHSAFKASPPSEIPQENTRLHPDCWLLYYSGRAWIVSVHGVNTDCQVNGI